MDWLNDLLAGLDKIQGVPTVGLVCASCIVVGYVLRFIKRFPNDGIPIVVILWGALSMLFLADPRTTAMSARVWNGRNLMVGLILGFISWMAHKYVIARIESFFITKFPGTLPEKDGSPSSEPDEKGK